MKYLWVSACGDGTNYQGFVKQKLTSWSVG